MAQTQRHGEAKRRRTTSSAPARPWADLPAELLVSVAYAASYPSSSLYAAVGHVCSRWRAAIATTRPPGAFPCRLPVLALQPLPATSRLENITAFPDWWGEMPYGIPRVVETDIAGAVGSSHGWLVVHDPDAAHLAVRNPATGHAIRLPSLRPLLAASSSPPAPRVAVHRVIVSHDPALRKDFVVLLFLAGVTTRCFTFRGGADAWVAHAHREFHVEDVVHFSGRFVAVDKENNLALFEWANAGAGGDHLSMATRRLKPRMRRPWQTPVASYGSVFLVDLSGKLLVATMQCDLSQPARREPPELKLDGHAVFLGHGNSVAVAGALFPELGTDVFFCPMRSRRETNTKHITDGAIAMSQHDLLDGTGSGTIIPVESSEPRERTEPPAGIWLGPLRPLWVVPNLLGIE
ncbi:hypothetical protein ACP4OV_000629 [Aristida adscensionis]